MQGHDAVVARPCRYLTGLGDEHGTMVLIVRLLQRNNETRLEAGGGGGVTPSAARERVCMFQMVPWFLQMWLHTLQIAVDGQVLTTPLR